MISLIDTYERLIASGEATRYATAHTTIESVLKTKACPVSVEELEQRLSSHDGNPYVQDQVISLAVEHEMKGVMTVLMLAGYPVQTPLAQAIILSAFTRSTRVNVDKLKDLGHSELLTRIQTADRTWKRSFAHLYQSTPDKMCVQLDSILSGCAIHRVLEALDNQIHAKTA